MLVYYYVFMFISMCTIKLLITAALTLRFLFSCTLLEALKNTTNRELLSN